MVEEILRERDQPGFDRNEYGSRMGGGGGAGGGGIEVRVDPLNCHNFWS